MQSNMHEAKTKLSQLAELACSGEQVIIAKAGKPFVEIIPYQAAPARIFGQFKGEFAMAEDFDSQVINEAIIDLFEGEE